MIGKLLCALGWHKVARTTGRTGIVVFRSCQRCGNFSIRKGW